MTKKRPNPDKAADPSTDLKGSPQADSSLRQPASRSFGDGGGSGRETALELRRQAEKKAKADEAKVRKTPSAEEARQGLHELRVHQIELEMQNEELRRAQEGLEAVKARYFDLYDLAPVGYLVISEQGLILEANLTAATLLGEKKGGLVKKPITRFILPEDQDIYYQHRKRLFETGAPQVCELRIVKKDGDSFWARVEAAAAQAADGRPVCRAVISNITERKRAEESLRESEERYHMILDQAADAVFIHDKAGRILDVNRKACRSLGYTREELLSKSVGDIDPDAIQAGKDQQWNAVLAGGVFTFESGHKRKDGSTIPVEITLGSVRLPQGPVVLGMVRDITKRKLAEEKNQVLLAAIQDEKAILSALIDSITDEVWFADSQGTFSLANAAALKEFGLDADRPIEVEALAKSLDVFRPDGSPRPVNEAPPLRALSGEVVRNQEEIVRTPASSELRYRQVSAAPVRDSSGRIFGAVCVVRDITERKRAEESLRASEENFRHSLEDSPLGVRIVSAEGETIFANQAILDIYGFDSLEELRTTPVEKRYTAESYIEFKKRYERRQRGEDSPSEYEVSVVRKSGEVRHLLVSGKWQLWNGKKQYQTLYRDITERKRAEEAVQASLREKEILLREIHHRVKNNMQVISSLFNLQAASITADNARRLLKEGQLRIRSMALVHEKLYQSRDLSKIDFADYLRSLSDHLLQFLKVETDRIRLETDLENVPLGINSAVPCGLLATELITNSIKHAFPAGRKGAIRLGLRRRPDCSVELRVADDGVGIPETLDFRSTESLGLQIVTLLVDQLEGTIELDRKEGTAYTIVFRESKEQASA
jgi:PAS domain S-box-containing protein